MRRIAILLLVALAGCAAANPNQTMMLTEDTALISVVGKAGDGRAKLVDSSLREAATFSRAHGYPYFTIVAAADASRSYKKTVRGQTIPNQNIPGDSSTFAGTNLSSTYVPGATYTTPDRLLDVNIPALDVTIRMYRMGSVDPAMDGVFNSDEILAKAGR